MVTAAKEITVIPDIHGRSFWKDAVKGSGQDSVVFLGDYLDPYPDEGISNDKAFDNLLEIVRYKEENPGRVSLLLGNHDLHYIYPRLDCSRKDYSGASRNQQIFLGKGELFNIVEETVAGGQRVLFSHAGVLKGWLDCCGLDEGSLCADTFNAMWDDSGIREELFLPMLDMVPYDRGGYDSAGSMIWAHIEEWLDKDNWTAPGTMQIFGHTRMRKPVNVDGRFFSLDCSRHFILDTASGEVRDSSDGQTIPVWKI